MKREIDQTRPGNYSEPLPVIAEDSTDELKLMVLDEEMREAIRRVNRLFMSKEFERSDLWRTTVNIEGVVTEVAAFSFEVGDVRDQGERFARGVLWASHRHWGFDVFGLDDPEDIVCSVIHEGFTVNEVQHEELEDFQRSCGLLTYPMSIGSMGNTFQGSSRAARISEKLLHALHEIRKRQQID